MIEPRQTLKKLYRYPVLHEDRYGKLRLDKNENTVGFPPEVLREILSGVTPEFLAAYPEPFSLYEKLAQFLKIDADSIVLTAGSEMAIRYIFEAFLTCDDELVILNPSFAMFEVYADITGATIRRVDYDRQFLVSAKDVIQQITSKTKIVAIANPNNPTGTIFPQTELIEIVEAAAANDSIVLIDEAYFYFSKDTMLPKCVDFPNLIVTRSFSKACGIAGVRLGFAVGAPTLISYVKKLQPIDHVNSFSIKIGEYVLDHQEVVWQYAGEVEAGKQFLLARLTELGIRCRSSHANFILLDCGLQTERIADELRVGGILVGDNLRFPFSSGYIRVTAGPIFQMQKFMELLRTILSNVSDIPAYLYGAPA